MFKNSELLSTTLSPYLYPITICLPSILALTSLHIQLLFIPSFSHLNCCKMFMFLVSLAPYSLQAFFSWPLLILSFFQEFSFLHIFICSSHPFPRLISNLNGNGNVYSIILHNSKNKVQICQPA